ncbi:MAG: UbiA family prenyltransferase [Deltaproteobacteria bacterium]|nr:UbiA family prenyltransferase [Deltaproteobacteria bacterium]
MNQISNDTLNGQPATSEPLAQNPVDNCLGWKAWLKASRPTFFVATLVPLFLGFFAAIKFEDVWRPGLFVAILVACFLVQLATNLCNDLFDYAQGVDTDKNIGGSRVIQEGSISPKEIKIAIFFCYLIAFILAIFIVQGSKILWAMVAFAALSSFFYVCPPIKYGHKGLGEVFVFVNMGLIMTVGCHIALTGRFDPRVISLALPVSFMVAGILYFQSLPEIETDSAAGKRTLAVIMGKPRAILLQFLLWPLVWLLTINLWCSNLLAWPAWLVLLTLPIHWLVIHRIRRTQNWLDLDKSGYLIRLMYLLIGMFIIFGLSKLETSLLSSPVPVETQVPLVIKMAPAPKTIPTPAKSEIDSELNQSEPKNDATINPQESVPTDSSPSQTSEPKINEPEIIAPQSNPAAPSPPLTPESTDQSPAEPESTNASPSQPDEELVTRNQLGLTHSQFSS